MLILGPAIQGASAALVSTLGFAVAAGIVQPRGRGRAMGIVGSLAPLGGIAGPGIGGQILSHFGWGAVSFVNLPIAAIAVALAALSMGSFRVGGEASRGEDRVPRELAGSVGRAEGEAAGGRLPYGGGSSRYPIGTVWPSRTRYTTEPALTASQAADGKPLG